MKTRILLLGMFLVAVFFSFNYFSPEDSLANSVDDDLPPGITITLSGNGSANASVWVKHESTGQIFYCTQLANPNLYRIAVSGLPNGEYSAYACSNYPSYGSSKGIVFNWPQEGQGQINLTGGECPFGD
jgi:hypothetical protein